MQSILISWRTLGASEVLLSLFSLSHTLSCLFSFCNCCFGRRLPPPAASAPPIASIVSLLLLSCIHGWIAKPLRITVVVEVHLWWSVGTFQEKLPLKCGSRQMYPGYATFCMCLSDSLSRMDMDLKTLVMEKSPCRRNHPQLETLD